jgi:hypothetical protein
VATEWTLENGRFAEEVFRPVADGWDVRENLFRFFQLPLDVTDDAVVDMAVRGVDAHLKRNSLSGVHHETAATLRHVVAVVGPQIRETARRAEHRRHVLDQRARFVGAVRREMRGMPALRVAELGALVVRYRKRFCRREIEEALTEAGVQVRDPVLLEFASAMPTRWPDLRQKLRRIDHAGLAAYLSAHGLTAEATVVDVARRRDELDRTGSGEALRAEQSVLAAVERLVTHGTLAATLRRELVDELTEAAEQGAAELDAVLSRPGILGRARALGLPGPPDLAYAVLCRARPLETAESTWRADYDQAVAARDLRAEVEVLRSQPSLPPEWADVLVRKETELAAVEVELAAAAAEETADPEAAASRYLAVLRTAQDPAAEAGLQRCHPPAPTAARTQVEGGRVCIDWTPAAVRAGGATYRVFRRVDDGGRAGRELIDETTHTSAVDIDPPGGVDVRYEVCTVRAGTVSVGRAVTPPVVVLPVVADLEAEAGDDEVWLRWRLPLGAVGVRLSRQHGAVKVELPTGTTTAHDPSARSGEHYRYAVEAGYDVGGERRYAAAAVVAARPQAPPDAVVDLVVVEDSDGTSGVADWTPPAGGAVVLWVTHETPPEAHTLLRADARIGERVTVRGKDPAGVRIELPADGRRRWIVPVTVAGNLAAVGQAVEHHRRLPPVTALRVVRQGHQVRLTWEWPQRAGEARVLSRAGQRVSGPTDPQASVMRISRARYERSGCRLPVEAGTELWFAVSVTAYDEGEEVHGPLAQTSLATPVVLRYAIVVAGRARRRFQVSGPSPLPRVQVRARAKLPPLTPDDGVAVLVLAPPTTEATTMSADFDLIPGRLLHLRAFSMSPGIEMVPENARQLRIERGWWRW